MGTRTSSPSWWSLQPEINRTVPVTACIANEAYVLLTRVARVQHSTVAVIQNTTSHGHVEMRMQAIMLLHTVAAC
jgi:hypothetical protein